MRRIAATMLMMVVGLALGQAAQPLTWRPLDVPGCGVRVSAIAPSPHVPTTIVIGTASAGIHYSEDGGDRWQRATGLDCLSVNTIVWHPKATQVVWACTMNGVYVSQDSGKSWNLSATGMPTDAFLEDCKYPAPITKVIFDPRDSNHMLAFSGVPNPALVPQAMVGAVWETRDGGGLWSKLSVIGEDEESEKGTDSTVTDRKGESIVDAAYPSKMSMLLVAVSNTGGFFESIDSGKTWRNKSKGLPHRRVSGLTTLPNRMDMFFVNLGRASPEIGETRAKAGGVYKTISGGLGWFPISKDLPIINSDKEHHVTGYLAYAVAPSRPSVMYACDGSFVSGHLFKSEDGGKSWKALATQKHFGQEQSVEAKALHQVETIFSVGLSQLSVMAVDAKNADVVYAGGENLLIRSKDGGKTWQDLTARKMPDGSWTGTGLGLIDVTEVALDPYVEGRVVLTGRGVAKILESLDGGKTWRLHGDDTFPYGGGNAVAFSKRRTYVGTGQYGAFGSVVLALGAKWQTLAAENSNLPPIKRCGQVSDMHVDEKRINFVYAIVGGDLYASSNFGRSWRKAYAGRDLAHIIGIPGRAEAFFLSGSRSCYQHLGNGRFSPIGGPRDAGKMACDSKGALYLASSTSSRPGVWRYMGRAWDRLFDEAYVTDVAIDPTRSNRMAISTSDQGANASVGSTGVWLTDDGGKRWTNVNEGLPFTVGESITFNPKRPDELWFATNGGGIYVLNWPQSVKLAGDETYASTIEDRKYCVFRGDRGPNVVASNQVRNPLRNGNMERGTTSATYWNNRWTGKGRVVVARDTTEAYEGEASLRIQSSGGAAKGQIAQVMVAGNVKQVTVSAYVKSSGNVGAQVAVQAFDAKWKSLKYHPIKHFTKADKWMKIEGTVVLPPGTARFKLGLLIEGEGRAWIDDVKMTVK